MEEQKKQRFSFPQMEERILAFWEKEQIFEKTLEKNNPRGMFIFYEGPPTANGKPGTHHVLARSFKDVVCRYKTMQGYKVPRKAGWDTHGLPVEIEVEKRLGITGKMEIEALGVKEFNRLCQESVWSYKEEWEKLTRRIGFWLDFKHPYVTYEPEYIESLWWVFKQIYDKGLVYKGHKVVPHCPRCGTSLSSHEVAQGYKEVTDNSVFVKFAVKKTPNTYLLAWTTTPWTLPGNVALAVNKDVDYVKVKQGEDTYILAENLVSVLEGEYTVEEKMKGADLAGMEYEPLFDAIAKQTEKKAFYVVLGDFVTTQDGTGIVHTAVMYGEDDYKLGAEYDLPKIHTVTENGRFTEDVKQFAGLFVKDAEKDVIEELKKRGNVYAVKPYIHDYPFCWRCKTALLYYAKDSWFIKTSELQETMIKENQKIHWLPEHIKEGRFGDWLKNVKDWAISRERYWGTPLPIWECEACKQTKCVGSMAELNHPEIKDLHRPYIDEVTFPCACGGTMKRVLEVMDCWFDSGAMPFAQYHYPFENQGLIDQGDFFPADYISEAIDQTRGWFYTLLAVSCLLGKGAPYKNVICLGHINDAKGVKMSKSLGNIVDPWSVINQFGTDALRLHLFTVTQPGETKKFDVKNVEEVFRNTINILYNVYTFYQMYAPNQAPVDKPTSQNVMDRWVVSKVKQVTRDVSAEMDKYQIVNASRLLVDFVQELSTWFVRRSRDRFKSTDAQVKQEAIETLGFVLKQTVRLMAPFVPFVSEEIYLNMQPTKQSVHLDEWPSSEDIDQALLDQMDLVRKIAETVHALRSQAGIKLRQPMSALALIGATVSDELKEIVVAEANVKDIFFDTTHVTKEWLAKVVGSVSVYINPELSDELKKEGFIRDIIRHTNHLRKTKGLTIADRPKQLIIGHTFDLFVLKALKEKKDFIAQSTLVQEVIFTEQIPDHDQVVSLNGFEVKIKLVL